MSPALAEPELEALDAAIDRALETGDEAGLTVLGYGEISSVVSWPSPAGSLACKRLPLFEAEARVAAYRACFDEYLSALGAAGVTVLPSSLVTRRRPDGRWSVCCVQPVVAAEALGPRVWASATDERVIEMFEQLVPAIVASTTGRLGIDGQLSNWVWVDGTPRFVDVSTPFLRDERGHDRLDTELFLASLPAVLRPLVRRLLLHEILDKYFDPRGVLLDLLGNLYKERLDRHVPALVERANRHLSRPIAADEPERYYASDRRLWALLQSMRRMDRWWQRTVRRRPYPFLLPGKIAR